jgi:glutaconate CoA-transferase subunit B
MTRGDFTLEELLIARMAREYAGEQVAVGATPLSDLAARLAKALHQPDLVLMSGGSRACWDCDVHVKGFNDEWATAQSSRSRMDWQELFDIIAHGKFMIWIGPVQIDRHGNSNISVVGPWAKPRIQLVGARGVPDDLWGLERLCYHVRRHSPRVFVEKVDFVCGLGYGKRREEVGLEVGWPGTVISDLGVFGWDQAEGHMRIESLHPGVSFDDVQAKTGFAWPKSDGRTYPVTAAPTEEELYWIREKIDPRGFRRIESREGSDALMLEIWKAEMAEMRAAGKDG